MSNTYDVMLAFEINEVSVELVGTFSGDQIERIHLTDYARELLRGQSIGSAEGAIRALFGVLGLSDQQFTDFDLTGLVRGIPGVGDLVGGVLEANVHLTDLAYEPGVQMELGILIDYELTVGAMRVTQVGLKITHPLTATEAA